MKPLPQEGISERLAAMPAGWALQDNSLRKTFTFDTFVTAFGFMAKLALIAEKRGHHPDWSNVYNKVTVAFTTHDAGGITDLDFELAAYADEFAAGVQEAPPHPEG